MTSFGYHHGVPSNQPISSYVDPLAQEVTHLPSETGTLVPVQGKKIPKQSHIQTTSTGLFYTKSYVISY